MYHQLEQGAWQPTQTPDLAWHKLIELTENLSWVCRDWCDRHNLASQNQTLQAELEQTKLELTRNQSIVFQVQEELEQYHIQLHRSETLLQQYKEQLNKTEAVLEKSQAQLRQTLREPSEIKGRGSLMSEKEYQDLVRDACMKYQNADRSGMAQCFRASFGLYTLFKYQNSCELVRELYRGV